LNHPFHPPSARARAAAALVAVIATLASAGMVEAQAAQYDHRALRPLPRTDTLPNGQAGCVASHGPTGAVRAS
jgi:hypothetical protein